MSTSRKSAPKRSREAAHDAVRVVRDRDREPRLPHDRDESADSQVKGLPNMQSIGRKAFDDVEAGRVDTDRGPVIEDLRGRFPSHGTPGPARKRRTR